MSGRRCALAAAAALATMLVTVTSPASAGTTKVSGVGVFDDACSPPRGSPPAEIGDYPPMDLSGSLDGCWYTYVETAASQPSGSYEETGTELFVGCLDGATCGTFSTTYRFTGKFAPGGAEIHGRCHHAVVGGSGGFAGTRGEIQFHDDVVAGIFEYRGTIRTGSASSSRGVAPSPASITATGGC